MCTAFFFKKPLATKQFKAFVLLIAISSSIDTVFQAFVVHLLLAAVSKRKGLLSLFLIAAAGDFSTRSDAPDPLSKAPLIGCTDWGVEIKCPVKKC